MIWTILGVSVAVVAVFCVSVAELLVGLPLFEDHRVHVAGTLAACGIAAWFVGRHLGKGREAKATLDEPVKIFVIFDLRYWGPMFVVLGVITLFIQTLRPVSSTPRPSAPTVAKKVLPPPEPALPKARVRISFPNLKIQGLIFQNNNSVIILNGRSYGVGDRVEDVTVKEINRNSVIVEKDGEEKTILLSNTSVASAQTAMAGK